jgi:cytochrome P450
VRGLFDYPFHPEAALRACAEVNAFLLPLIQARRAVPRADLISRLAVAEVEGHRLSDEDILGVVKLLFPAGADTTYLTLGSMMNAVLSDGALQARLRADASLIAPAVEETVRLFGAVALLPRYTESGARIGEVQIPPHSWVLFGVRSAGRDAAQYPQPERFHLARRAQRLVSFGGMPHFCLGVHLARAELTTSLALLLRRLPGLRLAHGPVPASSAVLRGVRRLPVAFDELLAASRGRRSAPSARSTDIGRPSRRRARAVPARRLHPEPARPARCCAKPPARSETPAAPAARGTRRWCPGRCDRARAPPRAALPPAPGR